MVRPQLRSSSLTANGASSSTLRAASTTAGVPARIVASLLLSRPPLVLPPLSEFEKAHHAYNKQLKTALSEPFDSTAYFAKGSQAERTFLERQQQQQPQQQQQLESSQTEPSQVSAKSEPLTSLERQRSRTLYLLLRKNRPKGGKGAWQFRESFPRRWTPDSSLMILHDFETAQGAVETSDASLVDAATRELYEEVGPNLDLFHTSRVPASVYSYAPTPARQTKVSRPISLSGGRPI